MYNNYLGFLDLPHFSVFREPAIVFKESLAGFYMHERLSSLHLGLIAQPLCLYYFPKGSFCLHCFLPRKHCGQWGKKPHLQLGSFALLPLFSGQRFIPIYTCCPFQHLTSGVPYSKKPSLTLHRCVVLLFHVLELFVAPTHLLVSNIQDQTSRSEFSLRMHSLPTVPVSCQPPLSYLMVF